MRRTVWVCIVKAIPQLQLGIEDVHNPAHRGGVDHARSAAISKRMSVQQVCMVLCHVPCICCVTLCTRYVCMYVCLPSLSHTVQKVGTVGKLGSPLALLSAYNFLQKDKSLQTKLFVHHGGRNYLPDHTDHRDSVIPADGGGRDPTTVLSSTGAHPRAQTGSPDLVV
jgi:hypothetical protein